MPAQTVIKIRRDTSTNWSSVNPTLAAGEIAFETDTNKIKVGDGGTVWASLDYASGAGTAAEISYDNVDANLIATTVKGALDELSNNKVDPADLTAVNTSADTTNFTGNLSSSDTTVQAALDTLDDLEISAGVTTSDTPPASPSNGDLWWESDTGILYIYYDNFWVEAVAGIVGPQGESGAVISDTEPADQDVLWVDTSSSATAESTLNNGTEGLTAVSNGTSGLSYQPVSHNYIINGAFDIWQRGDGPFDSINNDDYTADRWLINQPEGTPVITKNEFSAEELEANGFGEAKYYLRLSRYGATNNDKDRLAQRVEDARTLSGQTATVSFWARANSAISDFTFFIRRDFQSSSTDENLAITRNIALTTSWERIVITFSLPSATGKIFGADSYLQLNFMRESAGDVTFDIWGVQLEAGSIATPFKRNANSITGELAACQRYYFRFNADFASFTVFGLGYGVTSNVVDYIIPFPVQMRKAYESADISAKSDFKSRQLGNLGSYTLGFVDESNFNVALRVSGVSGISDLPDMLQSDNNNDAWIEIDAELL